MPSRALEPPGRECLEALFAPLDRRTGRPVRPLFCAIVIPAKIKKQICTPPPIGSRAEMA